MRWKFLLRPQFLEDVKKKLLNYISPRIGISTYYQFSPLTIACYIYIYICRKLATEKNCAKAGSEFYEKYGIDRKGINIVKIIQNVYGLSLKPTCGVSPLYSMVYPKEVQLCVELYPIKAICVRANFVILEKYRDIAPIISGGFEYKTEYEKKCYVKII